ncbi:hypothetical protein [Brevundimonas naejangsanensis]|uniref:hypothetical protein n=1 Tax=Brevundimonas naejangsanensis TaxID=588932 RepID=UPI0026E9D29C|nr:hypothetical protein [Brevundimonas naejangsanensis]
MTDPMELVGRLEKRIAYDRAHYPPVDPLFTEAAACIREMVEIENDAIQKRDGLEEDLYQAVLVAYRRGAVDWTMLNYPQWINAISAGREVCPPAPGAEA